jgi:hypothetical protein
MIFFSPWFFNKLPETYVFQMLVIPYGGKCEDRVNSRLLGVFLEARTAHIQRRIRSLTHSRAARDNEGRLRE